MSKTFQYFLAGLVLVAAFGFLHYRSEHAEGPSILNQLRSNVTNQERLEYLRQLEEIKSNLEKAVRK